MTDLGRLPTRDYKRLLDLVEPFEEACQAAEAQATLVDLIPFLPPTADPLYHAALLELVKIDLEYRWRHGRAAYLEAYLARLPALGAARELPAELIQEEYRVRQRFGDRPALESYRARFPDQYTEVTRLVEAEPEPTVVCPPPVAPHAEGMPLLAGYEVLE